MQNSYPVCLSIAGSDPSGGAGIQADLKTFSALGCYGAAAISAVTVQNTQGVKSAFQLPPQLVLEQIEAVVEDIRPAAIKIGMTGNAGTVEAVASALSHIDRKGVFIVLDPILSSSSGMELADRKAMLAMTSSLMPLCDLVTPNIPELHRITGTNPGEEEAAARRLIGMTGCRAVLVKGGHREGEPTDLLIRESQPTEKFFGKRILTSNTHGTGCTLSSAIAAYSARNIPLSPAVKLAKAYLQAAIEGASDGKIGKGHGSLCHFFNPLPIIVE